MKNYKRFFVVALPLAISFCTIVLFTGCTTTDTTQPARAASEQLQLSTAADRALATAQLSEFKNQKVYLDTTYFDSYDSKYAIGEIRDAISRVGALLVADAKNADVIIEARSGALSIDNSMSLVGLPSTGVPVPLSGALSIPEIAFYKSDKQYTTAKLALLAYANDSRAHIYSSGPLVGKSYFKTYKLLGVISWERTDLPEKLKREDAEQKEVWFPQYDLTNLPVQKIVATNSITATTNSVAGTNAPVPVVP
jgi:hypothetical protein